MEENNRLSIGAEIGRSSQSSQSSQVLVRDMERRDLGKIAELESICFDDPFSIRTVTALFEEGGVNLVLEDPTGIQAYLMCSIREATGEITTVATRPEKRRLGYARALFNKLLLKLSKRDISWVRLEVRTDNLNAIRLYESLGFRKIGVARAYYEDGKDAFVMSMDRR